MFLIPEYVWPVNNVGVLYNKFLSNILVPAYVIHVVPEEIKVLFNDILVYYLVLYKEPDRKIIFKSINEFTAELLVLTNDPPGGFIKLAGVSFDQVFRCFIGSEVTLPFNVRKLF